MNGKVMRQITPNVCINYTISVPAATLTEGTVVDITVAHYLVLKDLLIQQRGIKWPEHMMNNRRFIWSAMGFYRTSSTMLTEPCKDSRSKLCPEWMHCSKS